MRNKFFIGSWKARNNLDFKFQLLHNKIETWKNRLSTKQNRLRSLALFYDHFFLVCVFLMSQFDVCFSFSLPAISKDFLAKSWLGKWFELKILREKFPFHCFNKLCNFRPAQQFSYISSIIFSLFSCFLSHFFLSFLLKISFLALFLYFLRVYDRKTFFQKTSPTWVAIHILCLFFKNHCLRAIPRSYLRFTSIHWYFLVFLSIFYAFKLFLSL